MCKGYTKQVVYYFYPDGGDSYGYTMDPSDDGESCEVSEIRKNGQEDCHVHFMMRKQGGRWWFGEHYRVDEITEAREKEELRYCNASKKEREAVRAHVTKYGVPSG